MKRFFVITDMKGNCATEAEARRMAQGYAEHGVKAWIVTPVASAVPSCTFKEEDK